MTRVDEDVEKSDSLPTAQGTGSGTAALESSQTVPEKLSIESPCDPPILL